MRAGRLRKRITIETISATTRNTYGEEIPTWSTYLSAWASIEPLRGREYLDAKAEQAEIETRIRLRGQPGKTVRPSMRVKYGTRIFQIIDVINVAEAGAELNLMCKELVDG